MRRFVIGDIHGCGKALRSLIEAVRPTPEDELIFLGDYIDRGPDSRDVVDQVIELQNHCRVTALRGNHEIMLMGIALRGMDPSAWLRSGGQATITSYGGSLARIPAKHLAFFQDLLAYYETEDSIFVHANYQHDQPMSRQDDATTYWTHLTVPPPPHQSGKRVFVGHTPQASGSILDVGHLVCVDTYCFGGGYLTALELDSFEVLQSDHRGHMRRDPFKIMSDRLARCGRGLASLLRLKTEPMPSKARHPEERLSESVESEASGNVNPAPPEPKPLVTRSVGETVTNPDF